MKKKVQCILLDTKGEGALRQTTNGFGGELMLSLGKWGSEKHLCFISDEKIDGPCWCINKNRDTLYHIKDSANWSEINKHWSKVVATTNHDLWVVKTSENITTTKGGLPKIGDDFISAYIKAYNQGNPINEVNIEYDILGNRYNNGDWISNERIKLHLNGTVIISSVKEDLNPNNLKIGEEYWIKYLPCDSMWEHVKITRFTEQGYAWGEGPKHNGIIAQDLYDIKPFSAVIPKLEKTYTHEQLSAISFTSFIVGIANPQLSATELVEFHKEWFDRNYPQ